MKAPYIEGKKIHLRGVEKKDIDREYIGWLNDPEVNRYLEVGQFPSTRESVEAFFRSIANRQNVFFCILDAKTGRRIGNVKLGPIHWVHRHSNFGILIGDKRFWGKGVATEATRLVVEYAFSRLNLEKVNLGYVAGHASAGRAYEKAGFKKEGLQRRQFFADGRYEDIVLMGVLREDFEASRRSGR